MKLKTTDIEESLIAFFKEYNPADVKKGFRLHQNMQVDIEEFDEKLNKYFVDVPSESNEDTWYSVSIAFTKLAIEADCDCPAFEDKGTCKHVVAAAIEILWMEGDMEMDEIENVIAKVNNKETPMITNAGSGRVIPLFNGPDDAVKWRSFICSPARAFSEAYSNAGYVNHSRSVLNKVKIVNEKKETAEWQFEFKADAKTVFRPEIKYDTDSTFEYCCTCDNRSSYMCAHVKAAFDLLEINGGRDYFIQFKDWTKEKAKLLEEYGLKPDDKEVEKIKFTTDYYGNLKMDVPSWIWGKNADTHIQNFRKLLTSNNGESIAIERPKIAKEAIIDFQVGFLFNLLSQHFKQHFELETIKVFDNPKGKQFKKLSIHQPANLALLKELPDDLYSLVVSISDEGVKKYLTEKGEGHIFNYSNPWQQMSDSTARVLKHYYISQLYKLWPHLCSHPNVYILKDGSFATKNIQPVTLSPDFVSFKFIIHEDDRFITIWQQLMVKNSEIKEKIQIFDGFLFIIDGVLHLPADLKDLDIIRQFQHGFIKIPATNKLQVIRQIIPALQKKYEVDLPPSLQLHTLHPEPNPQILLKEYETKYLMLQPQFQYEDVVVDYESNAQDILQTLPDGRWQVYMRNGAKEKAFFNSIKALHPFFERQKQNDFLFLPFEDVMKKNWFLDTVRQMQDNDIPVLGIQELKKFRYNTNYPKWEMKAGSGIDWFDLSIEVSFGDQVVPLKEVRRALVSKQNMVVLGDGTIGMLPEEWLQQYGLILKIGQEQKDGSLRLSKLHYTLIDELHNQIDDEQVLKEINDKKQRLQNIDKVRTAGVSKHITASLRPYQESGLQWMQTLDELGWGGCLADDMGLGKTLQTISFLQYLKEKYAASTHLVICPTSLIYNWENELKKFGPKLTYHIYYGSAREFSDEHFEDYDIIITTYGLIRNDLEQLLKFEWHYVILDESQAIKNPDALTTKAVQLLKSKNRLILSGTPVQNNTYDLFAQFNFINPGLLGTKEFYKEFANGIDKNNDAEKSAQLRKMVYPFMLRRTKEQVAKDLPDKTEMVLWCEMYKEQQAVYDDYKNHYRTTLLKKIEEVGMAKAGMYILEGLLRLRQICDSPQLVKNNEISTNKSVKIDELMREIQENTGDHKLLVFSQFTEMLQLIKERMEQEKITYSYLDGSTPAKNRSEAVDSFQNNPAIKVFLISLKAGGVGLNLTAADYIYLVDPWWNPAVEQQAIDRTHRIGQKNKIFAYKMICKNSIEEKILQLQQRKKQIANELVTEDAGFIKKLSREDIEFLFN
ncbi:MAG: box helicase-like protein [Segetibacter sp.]|nr:box helicase-like protein [Segetibacter sp.]